MGRPVQALTPPEVHSCAPIVIFLGALALSCDESSLPESKPTASPSTPMNSSKEDFDELMNVLLPFAVQTLTKYKELSLFGATMSNSAEICHVMAFAEGEGLTPPMAVDMMERGFRQGASTGMYRATALAVDVLAIPPGRMTKHDAIEIRLDHCDGVSTRVVFVYSFSAKGELMVEKPFAMEGVGHVFSRGSPRLSADQERRASTAIAEQFARNEATLERLRQVGLKPDGVVQLDFFFFAPDRAHAESLKARLEKNDCLDLDVLSNPRGDFSVTGKTHETTLTSESLHRWVKWMVVDGIVENCDFDGWGAEVP